MGSTSKMNRSLHVQERRASLFDEDSPRAGEFHTDNPSNIASEQAKFSPGDLIVRVRNALRNRPAGDYYLVYRKNGPDRFTTSMKPSRSLGSSPTVPKQRMGAAQRCSLCRSSF